MSTGDDLGAFREYLLDQGMSESTTKLYVRIAGQFAHRDPVAWIRSKVTANTPSGTVSSYSAAVRYWLEFTEQPEPDTLIPKRVRRKNPSQVQYREALTEDELASYLEALRRSAMPEPSLSILLLLPFTGLRIGEACALPLSGLLTRRDRRVLSVVGKGDKTRLVPVSAQAAPILDEWLAERSPESPWLFPSPHDPREHVVTDTVRRNLRELRVRMKGEAKHVTPHVLRHTAATRMLEAGVDLKSVQAILGHANISTTARYLHPSVEMLGDALDKL